MILRDAVPADGPALSEMAKRYKSGSLDPKFG